MEECYFSKSCSKASACNFIKVTLLHGRFSRFSTCTNSAKSCKASHIKIEKNGQLSLKYLSKYQILFKSSLQWFMWLFLHCFVLIEISKTSRSQMFFKIGVLKNFAIFIGKHLQWSLFLIKLLERPRKVCNFIKKRFQHRCFPVNIVKCLRTGFYWTPLVAASESQFTPLRQCFPVFCCISPFLILLNQYFRFPSQSLTFSLTSYQW